MLLNQLLRVKKIQVRNQFRGTNFLLATVKCIIHINIFWNVLFE